MKIHVIHSGTAITVKPLKFTAQMVKKVHSMENERYTKNKYR
jgi:hypothetical protein